MENKTYDIFISYRRDGGEYTAKILRDRLEELGYRVFFDVESLRSGDFNTELYSVIDGCKDFLLILSPGALDRCVNGNDWVRCEVERALLRDKNIIPILLRGFSFPEKLPPSLEPVRIKNGLEANTQFFDAFIGRLQKFLRAKPPALRQVTQNPLFKRTLPVLLALLVVGAVGLAASFALGAWERGFPHTAQEKSVTSEVIYYTESHLTGLDLMGDGVGDAISAARRCLSTGAAEYSALEDAFELAFQTLEDCDVDGLAPDDGFLGRVGALSDAPFASEDLLGMHDALVSFRESWAGNLAYLQWTADPETFLTASDRMSILDSYETLLEEELKQNAACANELLLPITDSGTLEEFQYKYLPILGRVPLSAATWSTDAAALEAAITASDNRQQEALRDLSALVGSTNAENAALREYMVRAYMTLGVSRDAAEQYVDAQLRVTEAYRQLLPETGDTEEVLWAKLAGLVHLGYYDGAAQCVDAIEAAVEGTDPYVGDYLPALRLFLDSAGQTGINYGVMVVGWASPDTPNEVYQIGDVIVALNGQVCRTYEEYTALKGALPEGSYTASVLRAGASGALELEELELDTGMPPVYLRTLSSG